MLFNVIEIKFLIYLTWAGCPQITCFAYEIGRTGAIILRKSVIEQVRLVVKKVIKIISIYLTWIFFMFLKHER